MTTLPRTDRFSSLSDVIGAADASLRRGVSPAARVWPTGFGQLDTYLSGGLRSGELSLLGGPQGLGKTTFALQVLRHVAASGSPAMYFSFEHDAVTVLERLLAIEAAVALGVEGTSIKRVREAMEGSGEVGEDTRSLAARLASLPGGPDAVAAVTSYADRLYIHRASGTDTSVESIRDLVAEVRSARGTAPFVVVDYLQKVFVPDGAEVEEERVTTVVEGLKDLAMDANLPVLAVVAADKEGLVAGRRLRVSHLRGSSALAYEADVVLIMNDKYDVVARHHLVYDVGNAQRFRNYVVLSLEKNRSGIDRVDLEFRKRFDQGRFEVDGGPVREQLVDERVFTE